MTDAARDWDIDPDLAGDDVAAVMDRLQQATILTRRDPLRRGNVVHLPDRGDAVVVGDLHGDHDNFDRILRFAQLHRHRDRYLVVQEVIHGGPPDANGADQSFRLLEKIVELKCRFRSQVQMVLSNHDLAEVMGLTIKKAGQPVSEAFRAGLEHAYGDEAHRVHLAMRRFLASLPLAVRTANGVFISHSTPRAEALEGFDYTILDRPIAVEDCLSGSSLSALVWGRKLDQRSADRFAKAVGAEMLVTGHQSSMPGVKVPTSRHIVLTSDGPLGRVLLLPLGTDVPHAVLARQVMKVRTLTATA